MDWVIVIFSTDLYPAALELKYDNFKSVPGIVVSSWSTYALLREKYSNYLEIKQNNAAIIKACLTYYMTIH